MPFRLPGFSRFYRTLVLMLSKLRPRQSQLQTHSFFPCLHMCIPRNHHVFVSFTFLQFCSCFVRGCAVYSVTCYVRCFINYSTSLPLSPAYSWSSPKMHHRCLTNVQDSSYLPVSGSSGCSLCLQLVVCHPRPWLQRAGSLYLLDHSAWFHFVYVVLLWVSNRFEGCVVIR
jgi:hypothetical protein